MIRRVQAIDLDAVRRGHGEQRELDDVQGAHDARGVALERVGVDKLRHPVRFHDAAPGGGDGAARDAIGVFRVHAFLEAERRGQHLSRFVAWTRDWAGALGLRTLPEMLADLASRLGAASRAGFRVDFPWFAERRAPASGEAALVAYDGRLEGEWTGPGCAPRCRLSARVPVTSLCPCSKAVSDFGAHNQRGYVDIRLDLAANPVDSAVAENDPARTAYAFAAVGLDELIEKTEAAGSAPVYALLKRADERLVTMRAYEHPAFVEDLARAAALPWRKDPRVLAGRVRARTQESIHAHDAFAEARFTVEPAPEAP